MISRDPAALRKYGHLLRPGAVLRGHNAVAEKIKRHVLICSDHTRSLAFFINTQPSPFVRANPEFAQRQVPMPLLLHPFMARDSFIACHDTCSQPSFRVLARMIDDGHVQHLGWLDKSLYVAIAAAADGSRLIAARDAVLIRAAFGVA